MTNIIHPTAIIEDNVIIGSDNYIGPYCHVYSNTNIGNNNRFESFCSIGAPAQDRKVMIDNESTYPVIIGNNNIFREYCQVHTGTVRNTIINNNCLFLVNTHISHDSIIHSKVTIGNNTVLGGHTIIMEGANIGLGVLVHQYSKIGAYSMIGMGTIITKKSVIQPFNVYAGAPAKYLKYNNIAIDRYNITDDQINNLINAYENI
jgi:UDP-N-acetylglucosamine acyltransferase